MDTNQRIFDPVQIFFLEPDQELPFYKTYKTES